MRVNLDSFPGREAQSLPEYVKPVGVDNVGDLLYSVLESPVQSPTADMNNQAQEVFFTEGKPQFINVR